MDPTVDEAEAPILPVTNASSYLAVAATSLYYGVVYPIGWLLWFVYIVLIRPLWAVLSILAVPFIKIGQFIWAVLAFPFTLLAKFEVWDTSPTIVAYLTLCLRPCSRIY
jgi:hypothetical protein